MLPLPNGFSKTELLTHHATQTPPPHVPVIDMGIQDTWPRSSTLCSSSQLSSFRDCLSNTELPFQDHPFSGQLVSALVTKGRKDKVCSFLPHVRHSAESCSLQGARSGWLWLRSSRITVQLLPLLDPASSPILSQVLFSYETSCSPNSSEYLLPKNPADDTAQSTFI